MRRRLIHTVAALAAVLAACSPPVAEQSAIVRGDAAYAGGNLEEALAEYRLALLQGNEDAEVYGRVAHTYAALSRVDEAADHYHEAAAQDSSWADQAAADLVRLARDAAARDDLFGVASAMRRALEFRPGLGVRELALPLAQHYSRSGEYGRALPFYQRALSGTPADSAAPLFYEIGLAYEEIGDCGRALVFFEQYRSRIPRWRRNEVDWHVGNCAYQAARRMVEDGRLEEASRTVQRTIDVGEPRNLLAAAYFEKGRILSLLGDCQEALGAYRQVRDADVGGSGTLVSRARERIDEIRFGSGSGPLMGRHDRCGLPEDAVPEELREGPSGDTLPAPRSAGIPSDPGS